MDVITIVTNLTQLQTISRKHEPLTADQKLTVTRLRRETPPQVLAYLSFADAGSLSELSLASH